MRSTVKGVDSEMWLDNEEGGGEDDPNMDEQETLFLEEIVQRPCPAPRLSRLCSEPFLR